MTEAEITAAALELPPEEQLDHVHAVWDSVAPHTEFRLTPELRTLLETRLEEAKQNPDAGTKVEDAHQRIREQLTDRT